MWAKYAVIQVVQAQVTPEVEEAVVVVRAVVLT
jgi:hypothetical protein